MYLQVLLKPDESEIFDEVFTVTAQPTLEHLRDARNRWAHFDRIDVNQARQDIQVMRLVLTDIGATEEAQRMGTIQRTLELQARSTSTRRPRPKRSSKRTALHR